MRKVYATVKIEADIILNIEEGEDVNSLIKNHLDTNITLYDEPDCIDLEDCPDVRIEHIEITDSK